MATRKTVRMYARAGLDGASKASAVASFEEALHNLETDAAKEGREVLYDTLEVSMERSRSDEYTMSSGSALVATWTTINVDAEAVLK